MIEQPPSSTIPTYYLPSERESESSIRSTAAAFAATDGPLLFDTYPVFTAVLGRARQLVYANTEALRLFGAANLDEVIGQRPGEAAGCIHAFNDSGGCGTSEICRFCGAARSVGASLDGSAHSEECSIVRSGLSKSREGSRRSGCDDDAGSEDFSRESLDLQVWTKPLAIAGLDLVLMVAHDISAQKRREVLERIFYHDIANTAGGIRSLLEIIDFSKEEPNPEYFRLLQAAAEQLVEEIVSQRSLKEAEEGLLAVAPRAIEGGAFLEETIAFFGYYLHGRGIELVIEEGSARIELVTDPILLRRVLANMIKNALEASKRGDMVTARLDLEGGRAHFTVRNPQVMSHEAKLRIFHRSFSTKGKGRGIGTYSMRLLGEKYLGGTVSFESKEGEGTSFVLSIPLALAAKPA